MTRAAPQPGARRSHAGLLLAIALVSAALIAYEIVLMRRLLVERWHHFGYLVISVALLGFGASGPLLALMQQRVRARPRGALLWMAVSLLVALLLMPRLAAPLPVTARFIPDDWWRQVGWWSLYWLAALVPFLLGALLLGAALMTAGARVGRVYAANLLGSGVGAAVAALIVSRLALEHMLLPSLGATWVAIVFLSTYTEHPRSSRCAVIVGLAAAVGLLAILSPLSPSYDEYKYAARLKLLVDQGSARKVAARADPHGYAELYDSKLFHELPFLALDRSPPTMYALVVNGDPAGSILRIENTNQAAVLDTTLMALPYRLIRPQPAVLLVGETGGANVWLARRQKSERVDVVQPNAAITQLLHDCSPALFDDPSVRMHTQDPRAYLASADRPGFDLIQIVSLEGLGVGSAGMRGLAEDHLATVEGFAACLAALDDDGLVAISRGIQIPPRENIRLLATLTEALESLGVTEPGRHIIQVRDYLGVCTMALKTPLEARRRTALQAAIHDFNLTPVWYGGLPIAQVNQPDALDGPPGTHVDWLHHAASEIFSPRRAAFYKAWRLNVRPPHDDNPFFWDFYKPEALAALKEAYGDLWLTRAELGRLFLYASLVIAGAAAIVLILLPLGIAELRRVRRQTLSTSEPTGRGDAVWVIVYFGGIGLGFMGIEMALISRAIHWFGDPVIASALVIGGVLVASGVGSALSTRVIATRLWLAPAIVATAAIIMRLLGWWPGMGGGGAWLLTLVTLPTAILMGMPMPLGLATLDRQAPRLVPWAWGINGVASVIATSLAIVLAMTAGYRAVIAAAVVAYALAAVAGRRLAPLRTMQKI